MFTFQRVSLILLWGSVIAILSTPRQDPSRETGLSRLPHLEADTTAVILNWGRFPNVVRIVSMMCTELEDTLATIHIWNNRNTTHISKHDFPLCPRNRLKITNSPANIYFQARFLACSQADTPFCFIQDDDYLVLPEIVRTLRLRFSDQSLSAIYLLPPHEALSSDFRRVRVDTNIHVSFAWLGHGTIMKRSQAQDFLELMQLLDASEEEMEMADNYFSILANVYPEIWFDQGIELGGGKAFTQGVEGDQRNIKHISRAAKYLDRIMNCARPPCMDENVPFTSLENQAISSMGKAPCIGSSCLLETSIPMLPPTRVDAASASSLLNIEATNRKSINDNATNDYLLHPPSHAVDGKPETAFCIVKGNTLGIDLVDSGTLNGEVVEVVLLTDRVARTGILASAKLQFRVGNSWLFADTPFACVTSELNSLHECSSWAPPNVSAVRLYFERDIRRRGFLFRSSKASSLHVSTTGIQHIISHLAEDNFREAQEAGEADIQQHSRLVGRGKYIHGFEFHCVKPEKTKEYKGAAEKYYTGLVRNPNLHVKLTGSWETIVGQQDTFLHILEYENYGGYDKTAQLVKNSGVSTTAPYADRSDRLIPSIAQHLKDYEAMLPLINSRSNQLNQEFAFFPTAPPHAQGGIFELRSYQLIPGTLLAWENTWRRGIDARRKQIAPVGAWFSQVGRLHQVHHMWQYPNLETRKVTREKAWQIDGWAETVDKTAQLAKFMDSFIMSPLDYSPLK
ncbi:hypothetical protein D9757_004722 [Collybiopsis confluens]|uniref:NIPSNAP domain-containing protein n=1 Tax=Collybiopsis confluens TaxID=2823264 RepID=A0A8H5MC61_9AGAR|nr:hypothetical protein D9757_004722 [Collybiopsis confluens]